MVIKMARPTLRKGSGNAQFRKRVPTTLLPILRGKSLSVELPESAAPDSATISVATTISAEVVFSLRAPEGRLSRIRHAAATRQIEAFFEAAMRGPQDLSNQGVSGILGSIYRHLVAKHEANPPALYKPRPDDQPTDVWSEFDPWYDILHQADDLIAYRTAQGRRAAVAVLAPILDLDAFLASKAMILTDDTYARVVEGLPPTMGKAVGTLIDRARGDYSEDLVAKQFAAPPAPLTAKASNPTSSVGIVKTFDDLFERWKSERPRSASTLSTFRGHITRFSKFVVHDDPHRVERVDAQRWKDVLNAEGLKKISTTYLATFNALYRFGLENSETTGITRNPFDGVKIRQKAVAGTKRLPFTRAEVGMILNAARQESLAHLRWIPWLQAQTGARVAEIAQLWGSMIVKDDDGHPCIHITPAPDGGTLKNDVSERVVPIHPQVIADGFLEFVATRGNGPLFYGGRKGKAAVQLRDDQKHPSKGISNRVGAWVRGLGITDARKGPTHSFRHWFKSEMMRAEVSDKLADKIQGHSDRTDSSGYAHADTAMMLGAITKLDLKAIADSTPKAGPREL
ncbi:tyrosine-type recombinase/integrase [Rhizobiaceae bacterium n13]|uniref:Tyrosine-type recombinase/integrase n=1 Tax=Ferirhizobium litorale TaxID=2927786 RepID=A0AAE3QJE2_9HYPH|nr:tyrosine-type recombinase/integrase [Fererhizobium litorale]MDI7864521.1 tyrosine-type recombinase/integrase [Fererhizobium litorale]MDI7924938.1 tyrosine-type recombinase/integrase [Fererhizobium litorale]